MLDTEIITKYSIDATYDRISRMDDLFSGNEYDPAVLAEYDATECGLAEDKNNRRLPFDVVTAVCPNGNVITQVVVFRTMDGYEKYLRDGVVIFDDKEL